jgi:serine/threonine protein kinase
MFRPLRPKEAVGHKSPISRALNRLGITSTGFKTPSSRNTPTRNENQGMVRNVNLNKSSINCGLRENRRSISPVPAKDDLDSYELSEILGKGAYGLVKLGIAKRTGEKFAVKIYEKTRLSDPVKRGNVNREISILRKLSHTNIIGLVKMIENTEAVYLFTEFVPGCSLYSFITRSQAKKLAEPQCKLIFKQIVSAIAYCHSLKISHRDIKLENILIHNSQIKLIDFGFAIANQSKCRTFCGTPSYMAPELVNRDEYSPFSVDIWALGVLLYAMLCGKFPFHEKVESALYAAIRAGKFEIPANVSEDAKDLICKMLCVNAEQREGTEGILKHRWFKEEKVDRSVVNYMIKLGHDAKGIEEAVLDKTNYLSVIYDRMCFRKLKGELL